jgi:hypothetical protein
MIIVGHHPREEVGNNTILVTHTLHHTIQAIMPEAHNHPHFHLNNRHTNQTPANLIGDILITNNKVHHLITTARHLTIMARLHHSPMEIIRPEEGFAELSLHSISDSHQRRKQQRQEGHTCATFPGLPRLELEEAMLPRFMEQHNKHKPKVQHPQVMHQTSSVGLIIHSDQHQKTCVLMMKQESQERTNFKLNHRQTRLRNQSSRRVHRYALACQRQALLLLQ